MFDVIVPIYRISEEFILRALDSIKAQSFTDYEVYVCDGTPEEHQTYDAKAVVECYGFNYIRQDPSHQRVGGARNQAVAEGSNPYLAFLDGDDYWYSNYLAELKNAIEKSISKVEIWAVVLDCEYVLISQRTGKEHRMSRPYGHYPDQTFLDSFPSFAYYWLFGHPPAPTGTIVRREAYEAVGGYDESLSIGEDTEMLMRIVGDPRKIAEENRRYYEILPLIGGFHYIGLENTTNRGSQSSVANKRTPDEIEAIFDANSAYFLENHPRPSLSDLPKEADPAFHETVFGVMRGRVLLNI